MKGYENERVFEIAKAMAWVPVGADRNKTYLHLNQWIPDELKFDLNCLLYTHGKLYRKCIKKGGSTGKQQEKEYEDINSNFMYAICNEVV
ncbi:putative DNA glycosylase At3g47830 [Rosa chinensis]|uniref:putative DNA glycosylase At3g47830 n=1 Tax=Rosa chinensis TaxID=74649 RepID=UPI000D087CC8|nr:putative DNA glycosylase At3g47830 [Rosa chinensis]